MGKASRSGRVNVFSHELLRDLAEAAEVSVPRCRMFLQYLGAVMSKRLLEGKPCGIPGVGIVYVDVTYDRKVKCNFSEKATNRHFLRGSMEYPVYRAVKIKPTQRLRRAVRDGCRATLRLEALYERAREESRALG